jgi:hypothetical protein
MQRHTGWLWIVGFFTLAGTASAQPPSPPTTVTQFDGIYAPVSATKVNETFTHIGTNRIDRCGDYPTLQPLIILNGEARYPGKRLEGMVGSQGQLAMRFVSEPAVGGVTPGVERVISGRIDGDGTVRARQIGYYCSYDLIWQKIQTLSVPIASAQFDGTYALVSATKLNGLSWREAHALPHVGS